MRQDKGTNPYRVDNVPQAHGSQGPPRRWALLAVVALVSALLAAFMTWAVLTHQGPPPHDPLPISAVGTTTHSPHTN